MIDLRQGDCLELMKDIPDKSIDMILCDLPYGTTRNKWDSVIPFEYLWEQYNRIIKDNGVVVLFGGEPFTSNLIMSNIKNFKYRLTWKKDGYTNFLNAKRQPLRQIEDICVFYIEQPTYNPQFKEGKPYKQISGIPKGNYDIKHCNKVETINDGKRYPSDLLEFGKVKKTLHPTQKPIALLEYLIKTYTNENDIVLDNCMGSGSTGVACINTNRNFIGIELDENYFNIAKRKNKRGIKMKIEDYNEYYIQGSDHYLIPKDVFDELFNEMVNWREESNKQKELIYKIKNCFDNGHFEDNCDCLIIEEYIDSYFEKVSE